MNVEEISPDTHGTLPIYFETALPLTALTIWIVIAFQSKYLFGRRPSSFWTRLLWPVLLFRMVPWIDEWVNKRTDKNDGGGDEKRRGFFSHNGIRTGIFRRGSRQNGTVRVENGYNLEPMHLEEGQS